ncbi:putative protein-serine/threonine phosphatase [Helianthus annuus]|nr:putative protein-serine/threonine phosphatase [Helianthus annuus]KAJ0586940.1 putative protein-serine/threonine phosphatase [Helianthus annuus]KAJ0595561.1 putative protein-serine/threonine phosphatase [Helianthus annuus]KAJ0756216.1 putative protein-serine/threonine phosphatase [Helianthus annuus]KAJ0759995.1 putative protein-serine/threonine phosphatase [Helianthus annuus]
MEPRETSYAALNDGRKLCLECLDSSVMDTSECQQLVRKMIYGSVDIYCVVLDTTAGVWFDTKSVVTCPRTGRYSADAAGRDAAVELTRRCRHAAAAVGDLIFIYGGLRGGVLLDDLLVAEDLFGASAL